jgi:hypothetical protein
MTETRGEGFGYALSNVVHPALSGHFPALGQRLPLSSLRLITSTGLMMQRFSNLRD